MGLLQDTMTIFRFCDLRSTTTRITLTSLSLVLFSARAAWRSDDLVVTAQLAGLAAMVATCVPLTYVSFVELRGHVNLQRYGKVHAGTVLDRVVNPAGFGRWQVEIDVEVGPEIHGRRIRKWVKSTANLVVGAAVEVTLTPDWTYCRLETAGRSVWRTTVYLAVLTIVSISDIIESVYGVIFGIVQAVCLLHEQGCSLVNIGLHLLFAVCLGGALVSNLYCCFWLRRHAGLPSTETFEVVSSHRHRHHGPQQRDKLLPIPPPSSCSSSCSTTTSRPATPDRERKSSQLTYAQTV